MPTIFNDGRRLAAAARRLDRAAKSLPVACPPGHHHRRVRSHPFPGQIRMEVLDPIDLHARYGDDLYVG